MHNDRDVDDENRGKITNRERARQQIDFSGLRFGNMTPTDIDWPPLMGALEYHNRAWVFIEYKLENAPMFYGQRLCFARLTDDLTYRKPTLYIIASHNTHDPNEDIDGANASVTEYRFEGKWTQIELGLTITVRKMMDLFLDNLGIGAEAFHRLCVRNSNQLNMNEIKIPTETISLAEFVRERRGK